MKEYRGSRVGAAGTAILVSDTDTGQGYPLAWVDQWEWERAHHGTNIPTAAGAWARRHEWGYLGTGTTHTAASILADHFGQPQPRVVVGLFASTMIVPLPTAAGWTLTSTEISAWCATHADLIARVAAQLLDRDPGHRPGPAEC